MRHIDMVNSYMVKMQKELPTKTKTQNEKLQFADKLNGICSDKPYSKIVDMKSQMQQVRNNNSTLNLKMINATTSKIRTK